MESQVSKLAKFGSGTSMDLPNLDLESHAMSVTCIIKLVILQTKHNIFHISHHVVHIILSYAMRPWDHGLDIRTFQNEGSTYGTSTRELSSANTESALFGPTYFIFIHHILVQSLVIPRMKFKTLVGFVVQ